MGGLLMSGLSRQQSELPSGIKELVRGYRKGSGAARLPPHSAGHSTAAATRRGAFDRCRSHQAKVK